MELTTRECKSVKCDAEVLDLLVVGATGAHRTMAVDPVPATWQDGGRVRLLAHQPDTAKHPLATRLTHAGQAAGIRRLFRPHSDTCKGGRGRPAARSREANG
jgi:hypothetical protein